MEDIVVGIGQAVFSAIIVLLNANEGEWNPFEIEL